MNLQDALLGLCLLCEKEDCGLELSFETGRYIPGELINKDSFGSEPDPSTIRQGPRGWRVEVSATSYVDDNGNELLYPTLGKAISAGLRLLQTHTGNTTPRPETPDFGKLA
jgi:hypothetical protein